MDVEKTKDWLLSQNVESISKSTKLRRDYVVKVIDALQSPNIVQLNQLARVKGIGIKTLEKVFGLARGSLDEKLGTDLGQQSLL